MWRWLYLIQLAGPEGPPPSADLRLVPPRCARPADGEIVVCKPRNDRDRYGPALPGREQGLLPDAEFRLFGKVRAGIAGEQRSVGGFTAPAAMATVRIPF